jgi:hypothetical protein
MNTVRQPGPGSSLIPRHVPLLLGAFTALFALRVAGQLLTGLMDISILPPFESWYSGLIPYAVLLPVQIALLGLMIAITREFARGRGVFTTFSPRTGRTLRYLSYLYGLVMAARYIVTMALNPDLRWFTGTTPIWFHFVLAAFLFTLGHSLATRGATRDRSTR